VLLLACRQMQMHTAQEAQCISLLPYGCICPTQPTSHFSGPPLACRQTQMHSFAKAHTAAFFCHYRGGLSHQMQMHSFNKAHAAAFFCHCWEGQPRKTMSLDVFPSSHMAASAWCNQLPIFQGHLWHSSKHGCILSPRPMHLFYFAAAAAAKEGHPGWR